MDDQMMSWDPVLLRKYSSTGHFRLLNQLKNDLNKRGLNRDQATGELKMPGSSARSSRRNGAVACPQRPRLQHRFQPSQTINLPLIGKHPIAFVNA